MTPDSRCFTYHSAEIQGSQIRVKACVQSCDVGVWALIPCISAETEGQEELFLEETEGLGPILLEALSLDSCMLLVRRRYHIYGSGILLAFP